MKELEMLPIYDMPVFYLYLLLVMFCLMFYSVIVFSTKY
jgi:hypothetical protein